MKKLVSIILALLLTFSACFIIPASAKAAKTALPESGQLDFSKSSIKKGDFKYEFKTIDHVEYCRKVYADGYSTAYTVGVLFDSLDYAKTATEIKIVGEIDGIPVTEAGIEFEKSDGDTYKECYTIKVSEDTERLDKRYIAYNSDGYETKDDDKTEKQIGVNVEKITIPDSIKLIPAYCFSSMKKIKTVSLPKSLEVISNAAFLDCSSLETVNFKGDKAIKIFDKAFQNCKALTTVKFNKGKIETIGSYAFSNCKSLKKIKLPSSLLSMGACAFEKSGLETVTIPKNASTIGGYDEDEMGLTFRNCKALKIVTFSGKDVLIPDGMFRGCDKLQEINLKKAKSIEVLYSVVSTKKDGVLKINTGNKAVADYVANALRNRNTFLGKKLKCKKIKIYVGEQLTHNIPKEKYSGKLPNLSASATLKTGSSNKNVAKLKRFLNWAIGSKLEINNKFDASTAKAVKKFQKQCGLKATGVFGAAELKKAKTFKK